MAPTRHAQGHPPRQLAVVARHNSWRLRAPVAGGGVGWRLKVDEHLFLPHRACALRDWLASLRCAVALVHGTRSHVGAGAFGAPPGATKAAAVELAALLPKHAQHTLHALTAGHYLLEDAPLELRDALAGRLDAWAAAGLLDTDEPRRPELLGLRPLPQYDTIEEAHKALRGRRLPTMAVVRAALVEASREDEAPSDEEVSLGTMAFIG